MRIIRRALLGFGAFVLLYAVGAVAGAIIVKPDRAAHEPRADLVEVLLVAGPIHYDFLLPLNAATQEEFAFLQKSGLTLDHPAAEWLVMGWGAREFYTATGTYSDLEIKTVLKGLFGDQSVLRVDLAGRLPKHLETRALYLSKVQFRALLHSISSSFRRENAGQVIKLDHMGFSETDVFFEAVGRFDMFRTCNVWVGRQLNAAGMRFGIWTPTPYAITLSHWLFQSP